MLAATLVLLGLVGTLAARLLCMCNAVRWVGNAAVLETKCVCVM
jgi:hypothetical protein